MPAKDHNIHGEKAALTQPPPLLDDVEVKVVPPPLVVVPPPEDKEGKAVVTPSVKRQVMLSSVGDVFDITKVTLVVPAGADHEP